MANAAFHAWTGAVPSAVSTSHGGAATGPHAAVSSAFAKTPLKHGFFDPFFHHAWDQRSCTDFCLGPMPCQHGKSTSDYIGFYAATRQSKVILGLALRKGRPRPFESLRRFLRFKMTVILNTYVQMLPMSGDVTPAAAMGRCNACLTVRPNIPVTTKCRG